MTVRTLRGIRKYSTERASANEFGGTMQTSPSNSTKDFGSKSLGSTIEFRTLVKIRNSRRDAHVVAVGADPVGDHARARTWRSSKGSIMPCSRAMRVIQRSD